MKILAHAPAGAAAPARAVARGDELHDVGSFVLDVVSRPARDSGALLNLDAMYLNSPVPASIHPSVRAVAEGRELHLHPETVATVREALALNEPLATLQDSARSRILQGLHLLLHEGDHLAGPPFDTAARGITPFGNVAAARNLEEGLAELRASQLLPDLLRERFGMTMTAREASQYEGVHQGASFLAAQAVGNAVRNSGRPAEDVLREIADHTPSTHRFSRLYELAGDRLDPNAVESMLSMQQPLP